MHNQELMLAHWDGDEPQLAIIGGMCSQFDALMEAFRHLSSRPSLISLSEISSINTQGIELTMISNPSGTGLRQMNETTFQWVRPQHGWEQIADLAQPVVESKRSCHQYLSDYAEDELTILISKGEHV